MFNTSYSAKKTKQSEQVISKGILWCQYIHPWDRWWWDNRGDHLATNKYLSIFASRLSMIKRTWMTFLKLFNMTKQLVCDPKTLDTRPGTATNSWVRKRNENIHMFKIPIQKQIQKHISMQRIHIFSFSVVLWD